MSLEPQELGDQNDHRKSTAQPGPSSPSRSRTVRNVLILVGMLLLMAAGAVTAVYNVPAGHRAVVLRFGKFLRIAGPGLHLKAPFGIDRLIDAVADKTEVETFGFRSVRPGIGNKVVKDPESRKESLVLTGDLSVMDVEWTVEYTPQDLRKYLFNAHDPVQLIRDTAESVLGQIAGDRSFDHLLRNREEVRRAYRDGLQAALDRYDCGIRIVEVRLRNVCPPDAVRDAANEVNEARQQKERLINEALEAYGREIPRARGEASATVDSAQGYAVERVNKARGEASRFSDVLKEYRRAGEVTKKRLYLEACREVIPRAKNVIVVDSKQKNTLSLDLDRPGSSKGGEK